MLVPISDSILVTYCAICSSVSPRCSVSFSFFTSSEAASAGGTLTSVTRNTIHSLPPAPEVCPAASLAVRNAAVTKPAGTPGGEASRRNPLAVSTFDPIAAAYARSPEVTRTRLYIETIEAILARSHKIIVDGRAGGHTLVLPLDKLGDAGALKGAGVTGTVSAPAVTSAPAAPAAAPSSSGKASTGGDNPVRDDRGREREERQ